jgi:hypothetical protein
MHDRYDALKAVAIILRGMDKIADEMGKPGTSPKSLQYEWNTLQTKYQELMRRLEELPFDDKKASPDKDPGQNPKHEIPSQKNPKQIQNPKDRKA